MRGVEKETQLVRREVFKVFEVLGKGYISTLTTT